MKDPLPRPADLHASSLDAAVAVAANAGCKMWEDMDTSAWARLEE